MNRLILCVAAVSLWGCVPTDSDSAIRVQSARPITPTSEGGCAFSSGDVALTSGSLDISGRSSYLAQFDVVSTMIPVRTEVGGDVIADSQRNDFIAEQVILNYSSPNLTFEEETVAVYAVIKPQSTNPTIVDLLGPKAYATLASALGSPGASASLTIRFQLAGHLASGGTLRSTEASFPIRVFNSGFAGCASGQVPNPLGPCSTGGGQDGQPNSCCTVDATTGDVTCPGA